MEPIQKFSSKQNGFLLLIVGILLLLHVLGMGSTRVLVGCLALYMIGLGLYKTGLYEKLMMMIKKA